MRPSGEVGKLAAGWLFVYGTLLRGLPNHARYLAGRVPFAGPAWLPGAELYHLPEGYPVAVPTSTPGQRIRGELYRLSPAAQEGNAGLLARLDGLEDFRGPRHPENLYERVVRPVHTDHGQEVEAVVYLFARPEEARRRGVPVPGGDWRVFLQKVLLQKEGRRRP